MQTRPSQLIVIVALAALAAGAWPAPLSAQAQAPAWPSSSPPRALPAREPKFPPYELRTLPNGMPVVIVVHNEQPAVSIKAIVRAGPAHDPVDKPGAAAMVATLLDQGTATRTARQLADTIDSVGGSLETGIGRDLSFVDVTIMKDCLDLGMTLLADVLRRPAFAPEELDRQRQQVAGALRVSYEDPSYLADVVFDRIVYGAHPYGAPGNGTPASIEKLTRDDLVGFHRRYYSPNNCLLAVVGDVTVDEAMGAATKAFGDWARQEIPADAAAQPPKPSRRIVVVDKPGAVQTEIRVGHVSIPRKNSDYMAINLAVRVLGGEGANRLHRVLRSERGLTYGAQADLEALKRAGQLAAQTSTRSDATGEVLRLMVDEFARLRRERVGDNELADAQAYLTGNFPLTIETPDAIATQVLNVLFYDLPIEELQNFRQRVNAVSVDDIEWVTKRYLEPDHLTVVLVGNASAFFDQLKRVGFNKVEVVPVADLDLSEPDLRRKAAPSSSRSPFGLRQLVSHLRPALAGRGPSSRLAAVDGYAGVTTRRSTFVAPLRTQQIPQPPPRPADQVAAAPAAEPTAVGLIEQAIAAKGGLEKLKAVKTLRAVAKSTFSSPQGPITTETVTFIAYPDRFRVEARLPIGEVVQVFAGGDDAWVKDPNKGVVVPPAQARKDFRDSVQRDVLSLLLRAQAGQLTLRLREPDKGPDAVKTIRGVDLSAPDLERVTLYIDTTNGMVVRESYLLPGGADGAEESFTDYRDVDGVKIAFRASLRRGGLQVLTRTVTDVKVNVPIEPSMFTKPDRVS
jgi:predicted Zn-dependent peptidase